LNKLQQISQSIRELHLLIRDEIVKTCENITIEILAKVDREVEEDTLYAIDRISEKRLIEFLNRKIAAHTPIILIAEGKGYVILPEGSSEEEAEFRIIMDPIDGTRELMYQKRSAWILTGIALNRGDKTNLQDIEFAIQTEIPLIKQHLCDMIWAFRGRGITAQRFNRLTGEMQPINLQPSRAQSIAHGFAMVARFFPGARDILAQVDDEIIHRILGDNLSGKALCFEDQYLSTGGQLYELFCGHDRFVADLRPLLGDILRKRGLSLGLCCHPYDICTELIARESGVIITDQSGDLLRSSLNVTDNVTWIGYANEKIRTQVEPHLQKVLKKYHLL
jgi:fructose-1,6-bisphosphatase/inositol monophosphatase family enzyme